MFLFFLFPGEASSQAPEPERAYAPSIAAPSPEAELALRAMTAPAEFRVELFAAEPLVAHPVAFTTDEKGRFYVAESFRIEAGVTDTRKHMEWLDDDLASRSVEDRVAMYRKHLRDVDRVFTAERERIRVLEDRDGDGRADWAQVFDDDFHEIATTIGAGLLARRGQVWYTCIPHLWLLGDRDGDGRAEWKRPLHSGYGVHVGFYGHDLHGLRFGPDGRLYFSIGDLGFHVKTAGRTLFHPDAGAVLRCDPDGSNLEVFATGLRNPQELAFDDFGDLFTVDNNSDGGDQARLVHVVEGGDSGWRIGFQFITSPVSRGPWNAERMWQANASGRPAFIVPPLANLSDGPSGLCRSPGTGFPPRYRDRFFLCDFRGMSSQSGIWTFALRRRGATHELAQAERFVWGVLATDCDFAPDGALYLSDWVEGWGKTGKGRLYRVAPRETSGEAREVQRLLAEGMEARPPGELGRLLGHADARVRQEAQFALTARGPAGLAALRAAAGRGEPLLARIHAVWGLGQVGRREMPAREPLLALLEDGESEVRAQAARVLGDLREPRALDRLVHCLQDPEPRVRFHAAQALGRLGTKEKEALQAVLRMLEENDDRDPYLRHAGVMALQGAGDPSLLLESSRGRPAAVRLAVLLALRRLSAPESAAFLEDPEERIVLEAARAIHDAPIEAAPFQAALARLAALPLKPGQDRALALRILNASFRLGGQAGARRAAETASREDLPEEVRQESLRQLADWAQPSGRDRVLGLWRPLEPRPPALAAAALAPHLEAILRRAPGPVRLVAIEAAARHALREAAPALLEVLQERSAPAEVRAQAVRALEAVRAQRLLEAVELAIADPEPRVRLEGQKLLARLLPGRAVTVLASALESGTTLEKQGGLAILAGMREAAAEEVLARWLDRLASGEVPAEIQLDLLEAATRHPAPALRQKLREHEEKLPADDPLAPYGTTLAGGSALEGRRIFFEKEEVSCSRCHRAEGKGGEVGPDLQGVGTRSSRQEILESLLAPNRKIAQGFETSVIITREGQLQTGILKREDESALHLVSTEGKALVVPRDQVRERLRGLSAMPDDVTKSLTKVEIRDLVEYLAALK